MIKNMRVTIYDDKYVGARIKIAKGGVPWKKKVKCPLLPVAVGRRRTTAPSQSSQITRVSRAISFLARLPPSLGFSGGVERRIWRGGYLLPPRPLLQRARTPSLSRKNRRPTTPSTPVRIARRPRLPLQEAARAATKQPEAPSSLTVSARTRIHLVCPGMQEECLQ